MAVSKKHDIGDWSSRDLMTYWRECWKKYKKEDYTQRGYIGNDQSALKSLLDDHQVFEVALKMSEAIRTSTVPSIKAFCGRYDTIKSTTNLQPRHAWYIINYGTDKQRKIKQELEFLYATWFPDSGTRKKISEYEDQLDEWIEGLKK